MSGQLHAWPLYPRYPLDRRLDVPQSQSGCGGEEKNSQTLPGIKSLIIKPVAHCCATEISWLLIHCQDDR